MTDLTRQTKDGVFISHITEEKAVAIELQHYLRRAFGENKLNVFVSSDENSIGGGRAWWTYIRDNVKNAQVVLVLLSNESVTREWINYEAGVGDGAKACVIPVAIDGFSFHQLGFPLGGFQGRYVEDIASIVDDIARETSLPIAKIDNLQYQQDIVRATECIIRRGITLTPHLEVRSGGNPVLRFVLSNTGTRDVEVVEVEVWIPSLVIHPPKWRPGSYPVIHSEYKDINGTQYLVLRERTFGGHLDPIRYGTDECLPPLFPRNMSPKLLGYLKVPLKPDVTDQTTAFRYKVVAKNLRLSEVAMRFVDTPVMKE